MRLRDRKGQITNYQYDNKNRLKRVDYADGNYTENAYGAIGSLITIVDSGSDLIEYQYSDTGSGCTTGCSGKTVERVIRETIPLADIFYTYDPLGRRTIMRVPSQPAVNYQCDANSRFSEIDSLINRAAASFSLHYDALGRRTSLTYPNGVTTNYAYNNASFLSLSRWSFSL